MKRNVLVLLAALLLVSTAASAWNVFQEEKFTTAQAGTLPATMNADWDAGVDVKVVAIGSAQITSGTAITIPAPRPGGDGYALQIGDVGEGGFNFCWPSSKIAKSVNAVSAAVYTYFGPDVDWEQDYGIFLCGKEDPTPNFGAVIYDQLYGYWFLISKNSSWGSYVPPDGTAFLLRRAASGGWVKVAEGTGVYGTSWHTLRLERDASNTIKGYVDGTLEVVFTDPAPLDAGFPGMMFYNGSADLNIVGVFDDFVWEDAVRIADAFDSLDYGKYGYDRAYDAVSVAGGKLVLSGGAWGYPRVSSACNFTFDQPKTLTAVLSFPTPGGEFEFRYGMNTRDGVAMAVGIAYDGGYKLRVRRAALWDNVQTQNLSRPLVADEVLTFTAVRQNQSITLTLKDATDATLGTLTHTYPDDTFPNYGLLMPSHFLKPDPNSNVSSAIDSVEVRDETNTVIFADDFAGSALNPAKWYSESDAVDAPVTVDNFWKAAWVAGAVEFTNVGGTEVTNFPLRRATVGTFDDFDLQAVFKVVDNTVVTPGLWGSSSYNGYFGVDLRLGENATTYTEVMVYPTPGIANILGTGVPSPALLITQYPAEDVLAAIPIAEIPNDGVCALNIRANGPSIGVALGSGKANMQFFALTDAAAVNPAAGVINFYSVNIAKVQLDEYSVFDVEQGGIAYPATGVDDWMHY